MQGIKVTTAQFSALVTAASVLRELKEKYPTRYEADSDFFIDEILRYAREDFLDNTER
jgi:hypothetical protein